MDDRFKITYTRCIPVFSSSKDFLYAEIDSIEAILPLTQSMETGFIETLNSIRNQYRYPYGKKTHKNTLTLHYHDGRTKHLSVNISREDLQEAFKHIRILSPIHIAESY